MLEMKPFSKYLLAAMLVAGGAVWPSPPAHADGGGGYAGLIAPAGNTQNNGADTTTAPPVSTTTDTTTPANAGYAGLIASPAPDNSEQIPQPAPQSQQEAVQEQPAQDQQPPQQSLPLQQPETAALPSSPFDQPIQDQTPQYTGSSIASVVANAPDVQSPKDNFNGLMPGNIDGMPAMEYATEKTISHLISTVNDPHLSTAQRIKNARSAYKYLSSLAEGLRTKQDIPDSIYKNIGLSDAYIHAERASNRASLIALNTALKSLKPYQ